MKAGRLGLYRNRGWVPNEVKTELDHAGNTVYKLKITLMGLRPPVWRRVLAAGDTSLGELHEVIQRAMGWGRCHVHMFYVDKARYASRGFELDGTEDEETAILQDIAPRTGAKFFYEYDMGDGWGHRIRVESVAPASAAFKGPECLAGARACPPEDCGGIDGYAELLAALKDSSHERHEEAVEWLGEDFDSESFDLAAAKKSFGTRRER